MPIYERGINKYTGYPIRGESRLITEQAQPKGRYNFADKRAEIEINKILEKQHKKAIEYERLKNTSSITQEKSYTPYNEYIEEFNKKQKKEANKGEKYDKKGLVDYDSFNNAVTSGDGFIREANGRRDDISNSPTIIHNDNGIRAWFRKQAKYYGQRFRFKDLWTGYKDLCEKTHELNEKSTAEAEKIRSKKGYLTFSDRIKAIEKYQPEFDRFLESNPKAKEANELLKMGFAGATMAPIIGASPILTSIMKWATRAYVGYGAFKVATGEQSVGDYAADLTIVYAPDIAMRGYKIAKTGITGARNLLTKDYVRVFETDPTMNYSFDKREKILKPKRPLRLTREGIELLQKATWKGKDPKYIRLPERNYNEIQAKKFLQENQDTVLAGSRSFYEQAANKVTYPESKDFDFKTTGNPEAKARDFAKRVGGYITSKNIPNVGKVYSVKKNKKIIADFVKGNIPSVTTGEGIKLSNPEYEIWRKWGTTLEPIKTTRRARTKDLPKLKEALQIYEHNIKNPERIFSQEHVAWHTGETLKYVRGGKYVGKQVTPSQWETMTGQAKEPITFFGQNEQITFFRKGSADALKLSEKEGTRFIDIDDLPKRFRKPAKTKKDAIKQIKDYIEYIKKYHQGDVVPSPQAITSRTYKGAPTQTPEKEWIIIGEIKGIKQTGFAYDPFAKRYGYPSMTKIISKGRITKGLLKRTARNIKAIYQDIKTTRPKIREIEAKTREIAKKIRENKRLTPEEKEFAKKETRNPYSEITNEIKKNKGRTKKTRKTYEEITKAYEKNKKIREDIITKEKIARIALKTKYPTNTTYSSRSEYSKSNVRRGKYQQLVERSQYPTYPDSPNYPKHPYDLKYPNRPSRRGYSRTTYPTSSATTEPKPKYVLLPATKIKKASILKGKIDEQGTIRAWQAIILDKKDQPLMKGELFRNKEGAIADGMNITDIYPTHKFKIASVLLPKNEGSRIKEGTKTYAKPIVFSGVNCFQKSVLIRTSHHLPSHFQFSHAHLTQLLAQNQILRFLVPTPVTHHFFYSSFLTLIRGITPYSVSISAKSSIISLTNCQ